MKRYWASVPCAVLMVGVMTLEGRAQSQAAQAHVTAAKAAASPKTANPKPWQVFDSLFRLICTQPRQGARPQAVGPGEPDEQAKLKATPRDEWYVAPAKVFDNLYYIGTKSESTWATVNLVAPGTLFGERANQVDLRIAKLLRFNGTRTMLNVDIFNALNANPVLVENANFAVWRTPTDILTARFVRFSVQYDF